MNRSTQQANSHHPVVIRRTTKHSQAGCSKRLSIKTAANDHFIRDGLAESPIARVQRGPSEAARCASTGDSPSHPSPAGGLFQQPA